MRSFFAIAFLFATLNQAIAAPLPVPAAPKIAAKSYLLLDPNSNKIIAEKESTQRVEPASITKLLTAYVVFSELRNAQLAEN